MRMGFSMSVIIYIIFLDLIDTTMWQSLYHVSIGDQWRPTISSASCIEYSTIVRLKNGVW